MTAGKLLEQLGAQWVLFFGFLTSPLQTFDLLFSQGSSQALQDAMTFAAVMAAATFGIFVAVKRQQKADLSNTAWGIAGRLVVWSFYAVFLHFCAAIFGGKGGIESSIAIYLCAQGVVQPISMFLFWIYSVNVPPEYLLEDKVILQATRFLAMSGGWVPIWVGPGKLKYTLADRFVARIYRVYFTCVGFAVLLIFGLGLEAAHGLNAWGALGACALSVLLTIAPYQFLSSARTEFKGLFPVKALDFGDPHLWGEIPLEYSGWRDQYLTWARGCFEWCREQTKQNPEENSADAASGNLIFGVGISADSLRAAVVSRDGPALKAIQIIDGETASDLYSGIAESVARESAHRPGVVRLPRPFNPDQLTPLLSGAVVSLEAVDLGGQPEQGLFENAEAEAYWCTMRSLVIAKIGINCDAAELEPLISSLEHRKFSVSESNHIATAWSHDRSDDRRQLNNGETIGNLPRAHPEPGAAFALAFRDLLSPTERQGKGFWNMVLG